MDTRKKDKTFDMYPKPPLPAAKFYSLSVGEKVNTRFMGPGIVIYPPVKYKHDNGVERTYISKATVKLTRKCWAALEPWEFSAHELTTHSYCFGD